MRKNPAYKKIERICVGISIFLVVLITACLMWWMLPETAAPFQTGRDDTLAERMDLYPTGIMLGEKLPVQTLQDENGKSVDLRNYRKKTVVLMFWASWCSHCQEQLQKIEAFETVLSRYSDTELLLINKLDGTKETKEQAQNYLKQNQIPRGTLYDADAALYEAAGLQIIPTTVILNVDGSVGFCYPGALKNANQLEAMLQYVNEGASAATESFMTAYMMEKDGGIRTQYAGGAQTVPSGGDTLSESQGLMMEYAVVTGQYALFEKAYRYADQQLKNRYGLFSWVRHDSENQPHNTLLDDLRIYRALADANQLWGGYDEDLRKLGEAIREYNVRNSDLVDFFEESSGRRSSQLSLAYADFEALGLLGASYRDQALEVIRGGYISDAFPFYYSSFDYLSRSYSQDPLNMIEALYTIYHLAKIGEMPEATGVWLKEKMAADGIRAKYTVQGEVAPESDFDSTGVYAMVGLIAQEIGDSELLTQALWRMELTRTLNVSSPFNGAFGQSEEDIRSFDQLAPLVLYGYLER